MNLIDQRLARLRERLAQEGRAPTPAERRQIDKRAAWLAEQAAINARRAAAAAKRQAHQDGAQRRWHQRYYMQFREWHPHAGPYIRPYLQETGKTWKVLESALRSYANRKRTRVGTGRNIRYTD